MPKGVREAADGVTVFDVIKVNIFGSRQPRRIAVYPSKRAHVSGMVEDPTQNEVHILSMTGSIRRRITSEELVALEKAIAVDQDQRPVPAVDFHFSEKGKSRKRKIIFKDKEGRDYFIEKLTELRTSLRQDSVSLAASSRSSIPVDGNVTSATKAKLAKVSKHQDGRHHAHSFTIWNVQVESKYGLLLNYRLEIHESNGMLILKDDSISGRNDFDLSIKALRRIDVHYIDPTAVKLSFSKSITSGHEAPSQTIVLCDSRQEFVDKLMNVYFQCVQYPDSRLEAIRETMINTGWYEALPVSNWLVFEVTRTTSGIRGPRFLLLNPDERILQVMFSVQHAPYFTKEDEPEQTIYCSANNFNVERSVFNDYGIRIRLVNGSQNDDRHGLSFDFPNHGERERFLAYLNQINWSQNTVKKIIPEHSALWGFTKKYLWWRRAKPDTTSSPREEPQLSEPNENLDKVTTSGFEISKLWGSNYPTAQGSVFVGTYNCSGKGPPDDIRQLRLWIPRPHFNDYRAYEDYPCINDKASLPYDVQLYVIGFQELGQQKNREAWTAALEEHLNSPPPNLLKQRRAATVVTPTTERRTSHSTERIKSDAYYSNSSSTGESKYRLLKSEFMWEIGILVFIKAEQYSEVSNLSCAYEATGLSLAKNVTGKQLGNKGGVGIGFRWRGTTMAFISCHLAARIERVRQRENDYRQILTGLALDTVAPTPRSKPNEGHNCDILSQHDFVWVLGDLNYRTNLSFDEAADLYKQGNWDELCSYDQLLPEKQQRRVLDGFEEPKINFPPTYRYETKGNDLSNKRGQAPSYTDRIMVKSLPGFKGYIKNRYYGCAWELLGSDHRPVSSVYSVVLPFPYIAIPRPVVQTNIPAPTFFANQDQAHYSTPFLVFKEVKITQFQAVSAPPSMFLSFHSELTESNIDAPCSPTIEAHGVTPEQFSALDDLRVEMKNEKRRSKKATRTATGSGSFEKPRTARRPVAKDQSFDDDSDDDEDEDEPCELAAHIFTDFNCFSISGDVDSLPNMDPTRRTLLKLEARYFFDDRLPPLKVSQWDPRWLRHSHVIIIAQHITFPRRKPATVGWAVLPLKDLCDLCAEKTKIDEASEKTEIDGVPSYLKADPLPFQIDLVLGAQPVATMSGYCALRSTNNLDFECARARHPSSAVKTHNRPGINNHEERSSKRPPPPPPRPPTPTDSITTTQDSDTDSDITTTDNVMDSEEPNIDPQAAQAAKEEETLSDFPKKSDGNKSDTTSSRLARFQTRSTYDLSTKGFHSSLSLNHGLILEATCTTEGFEDTTTSSQVSEMSVYTSKTDDCSTNVSLTKPQGNSRDSAAVVHRSDLDELLTPVPFALPTLRPLNNSSS